MKKTIINLALVGMSAQCLNAAVLVSGTEIGFDFGVANTTTNWNDGLGATGSVAANTAIDTSGVVVDNLSLTYSSTGMNAIAEGTQGDVIIGTPAVILTTVATDNLVVNEAGAGFSIILGGLDDSLTYDIIVGHGNNAASGNTDTTWTVGGVSQTTDASTATAYVTFTGVTTDGSGGIQLTSEGAGGNLDVSALSGLVITAVPEPSSVALLSLGGFALISRRRRA